VLRKTIWSLAATAALAGLVAGCSPAGGRSNGQADTLKIGAYSVVKEVFQEGLLPAFRAHWKQKTGRDVTFEEAYNGSGAQARAIASGFDADIAVLSLEDHMKLLVDAGKVRATWNAGPNRGMVTNSVVALGYRDGNPRKIQGWEDLTRPGLGVLYPDPKTSGGARWNVGALYGFALRKSQAAHGGTADPCEVRDYLAKVQANVVNMDPSGRQSMVNFERGTGDVVVTYENELLLRKKQGHEVPFLVPDATLLIESPAAVVDASVERHGNRALAEAFLAFLLSADGQRILADYGFRPIDPGLAAELGRPRPPGLFTIEDLGGWDQVKDKVFGPDGVWTSVFTAGVGGK